MSDDFTCPLCERLCPPDEASRHHVLPKSRGGRQVAVVCRDCHQQVHRLFSVKDLARRLNTLDALRATPEVQAWIAWVRRKPFSLSRSSLPSQR